MNNLSKSEIPFQHITRIFFQFSTHRVIKLTDNIEEDLTIFRPLLANGLSVLAKARSRNAFIHAIQILIRESDHELDFALRSQCRYA